MTIVAGRVLDKLYVTGLSQSFTAIALEAAVKFDVCLNTVHLDSSSFHLHGEYKYDAERGSRLVTCSANKFQH